MSTREESIDGVAERKTTEKVERGTVELTILHAKSDWVYLTTLIKYLKVKYIVSVVFPVLT